MSRSIVRRVSDPALELEIKQALGGVPELPRHLMQAPWLLRQFMTLGAFNPSALPSGLADLVFYVVSRDNACRYCAGFGRVLLSALGYRERTIDRLERELPIADLDPKIDPALDVARKLSRFNPPPRAPEFARLRALGMDDAAIVELVFVAARTTHANRIATFLDIPPEAIAERPRGLLFRLIAPLIRWRVRAQRRRPATPPPAASPGAYEPLLAPLAPVSLAQAIVRAALARALESQRIPRRTAAMITAVIARALGSPHTEALALAEAEAAGLAPDAARGWLRRLTGPEMSPLERELIPLARETARYQVHLIKPRFAALSERLDDVTVIEAAGLFAQANMLCRLETLEHAH